MALRKQRRPFLATLWAAVPAILLSIAATYALSRLGALNGLERLALDAEMAPTPRQEVPISIVDINDSDYNNIFSGTSPLNPDKLHSLISAVAKSKPAVIGIDIDTSDRQFRTFKPESNWPTVIWERDIASLPAGNDAELEPLDVLGAQDPKRDEMSGIPVLLDDPEDKETRFYTRCVETKAGLQRTFVSAVVEAYRSARQKKEDMPISSCPPSIPDPTGHLFIFYSLKQKSLDYRYASQVLGRAEETRNAADQQIPSLADHIVIIGGSYRDSDRHYTPIGRLPGEVVLANAIQTELDNVGVKAYPQWALFVIEFIASALFVWFLQFFSFTLRGMLLWGLLATIVVSVLFSFLSFHTMSRFVSFAPTLAAVLVFEIYDHLRQHAFLHASHSGEHSQRPGQGPNEHG